MIRVYIAVRVLAHAQWVVKMALYGVRLYNDGLLQNCLWQNRAFFPAVIAPSDFYLFGILKCTVRGETFVSDDEVTEAVAVSAELELIQEE
jgi:hypothetical protein